jgi:hypothetical protein
MKEKTGIIKLGGNILYSLLIFIFVADPTNTILGLKSVVFALLLLYSMVFFKPDWSNLRCLFIPILSVLVSWILAVMQGQYVDMTELKAVIIAFAPLSLLMWSANYDVIKLSVLPVTIAAIVVLVLFWYVSFVPEFEAPLYLYMGKHDDTMMMSNRAFLGFSFFSMYLKSAVSFLPVFAFVLYKALNQKRFRLLNVLVIVILLHMFIISGTRSSMLLPILLACIILFIYCRNGRYMRYAVYPTVVLFCFLFLILLVMLLMEKDEVSNLVKYGHLTSYKTLFSEHPEYLLFGQGPGTSFYSLGFKGMAIRTEWTYLELIRNYGILCLPILYVIVLPLYKLLKVADKCDSALAIASSFFIFSYWLFFLLNLFLELCSFLLAL